VCLESLGFYGICTNLVIYLSSILHKSNISAATSITIWAGASFFTPFLGALVADSYLGSYRTIFYSSLIYILVCYYSSLFLFPLIAIVRYLFKLRGAFHNQAKRNTERFFRITCIDNVHSLLPKDEKRKGKKRKQKILYIDKVSSIHQCVARISNTTMIYDAVIDRYNKLLKRPNKQVFSISLINNLNVSPFRKSMKCGT